MKTYLIFAISLLSTSFTFSQTVVIDGVPRDTSFALNTTYQKELRYRPYIEPVRALKRALKSYINMQPFSMLLFVFRIV